MIVTHFDVVEVAVIFVIPLDTVVPKALVVRQTEASAGVQADDFGCGLNFPPGPTLSPS